jgi:alpha-L-fucosidase
MRKVVIVLLMICIAALGVVSAQENDIISKEWAKMQASKDKMFKEFNELKFGMFIHWGVYSKLGGIWDGEHIDADRAGHQANIGEWIMYSARIPRARYLEVAKTFNPVDFDADEWVKVAKDAGMRYIVAMTKHHDGFAMYDSDVSEYNIHDYTPFKRDPIEELYNACKKYGIRLGLYYSHSIDWMDGGDSGNAQYNEANPDKPKETRAANLWDPAPVTYEYYLENKAKPQMREILTKFPNLVEIWYDYPRFMNRQQSFEFYKLAYDYQPQALINSRVGNGFGDFATGGDNQISPENFGPYRTWESPATLNNTWGYKSYDDDWKTVDELLIWVVELASKGGNYLLNVGPDGNGVIPEESVKVLRELGEWMKINGEAIYGTKRWTTLKEGKTVIEKGGTEERLKKGFATIITPEDFWFTTKDNYVYAMCLAKPVNNMANLKSLYKNRHQIKSIRLLGYKKALRWNTADEKIVVELPPEIKPKVPGFVLKFELSD